MRRARSWSHSSVRSHGVGGPSSLRGPSRTAPGGRWSSAAAAALSGVPDLFIGALSEETGIPGARLAPLVTGASRRELAAVLRALELDSDQAYLIVSALHPARFGHAEAIRMFLDAYDAIDDDMAAAVVAALAPANRSEAPRRSA